MNSTAAGRRSRHARMPFTPSRAGFTLIELIMTVVILSIAIGGLLVAVGAAAQHVVLPYITQIATGLAEQELERVTGLRFSQVASASATPFASPFADYTYQIIVSAVPVNLANDPGLAQYKQVKVAVAHAGIGSVGLTTVVTNN